MLNPFFFKKLCFSFLGNGLWPLGKILARTVPEISEARWLSKTIAGSGHGARPDHLCRSPRGMRSRWASLFTDGNTQSPEHHVNLPHDTQFLPPSRQWSNSFSIRQRLCLLFRKPSCISLILLIRLSNAATTPGQNRIDFLVTTNNTEVGKGNVQTA